MVSIITAVVIASYFSQLVLNLYKIITPKGIKHEIKRHIGWVCNFRYVMALFRDHLPSSEPAVGWKSIQGVVLQKHLPLWKNAAESLSLLWDPHT